VPAAVIVSGWIRRPGKMNKEYVKKVEDVHRVGETRVSVDSLVYLFREGMSAREHG
jgi:hypothetical protein